MKYYETTFDEYCKSARAYNMHPDPDDMPGGVALAAATSIAEFRNLIIHGTRGIGKYTQALLAIEKYSPSRLSYETKITIFNDKQKCEYRMSDIHCEIDMYLLGCNAKALWIELFTHMVESVSVKRIPVGIIMCKNFHAIHPELLDVFYSYIQQYSHPSSTIQIRFLIITEHIGFVADDILARCDIRGFARPAPETYAEMVRANRRRNSPPNHTVINAATSGVKTCKELYTLSPSALIQPTTPDIDDTIFNAIRGAIDRAATIPITEVREILYDIMIYGEDIHEITWRLFAYYTSTGAIRVNQSSSFMTRLCEYLKFRNNNYREIFHLERIFFAFVAEIARNHHNNLSA